MEHRIWSIVVAAGSGRRFGAAKQFETLGNGRVIDRSLAVARSCSDGVVAVVPPGPTPDGIVADAVVPGGVTRSDSVRAGLAAVPDDATIVLVHDAARPAASAELYRRVIGAVAAGADAVVPAIEVADTIRRRDGGVIDRSELLAVQTPQGFSASALRAAHASEGESTDDAGLVELAGGRVVTVPGERANIKITEPSDLANVARTVRVTPRQGVGREGSAVQLRVGNGFDVHRFSDDPTRPLILGGVTFEGAPGLHGHSDADVVAHACAEALLGAAGRGDLGSHFPDTDERWRGANSLDLLAEVVRLVRSDGWDVSNIDASVIAETPKLAPRRAEMEAALTAVVGVPVTVKGRRAEGIGGLGRREGIAALANALLISTAGSAVTDERTSA